jgi:hypothetical protein
MPSSDVPADQWLPMNSWLFASCLVLLIAATLTAFIYAAVQFHRRSRTLGEFNLRIFLLGLLLSIPCALFWLWETSGYEGDFAAAAGTLISIFSFLVSAFAAVFIVYGGLGMLTTRVGTASGNVVTTTSTHCPHCGAEIGPFDLPTRGTGKCRTCGRHFGVPSPGSLLGAIRQDLARLRARKAQPKSVLAQKARGK